MNICSYVQVYFTIFYGIMQDPFEQKKPPPLETVLVQSY